MSSLIFSCLLSNSQCQTGCKAPSAPSVNSQSSCCVCSLHLHLLFCLECSEISHQGSQQEGWDFFQYKSSTWCLGHCLSPKNALGNCQKWGRTGMSPPGTSHVHLLQPPQPLPWSPTSCTDDMNLMCLWLLWINHSGYRVYLGAAFAWVWHALGNQISQCICSEYVPVLQGRPPKSHLERSCAWLWVKLVINSRNWS